MLNFHSDLLMFCDLYVPINYVYKWEVAITENLSTNEMI